MNHLTRFAIPALFFATSLAGAADSAKQNTPLVWSEAEIYIVPDKAVIMHTHPAFIWDNSSTCRKGIRDFDRVLDAFYSKIPNGDKRRLPRFLFISDDPMNDDQYFLKTSDVPTIVNSAGGAHNIHFPNADTFIFTGGNFGMCMCETVRDAVKGTEAEKRDFTKQPLTMVFITDAIYCNAITRPEGMPSDVRKTPDDNLAGIVQYSTNEELLKEVSKNMFNEKDDRFCGQRTNKKGQDNDPKVTDYTVTIVKDNVEIGKIGKGKQLIRAEFVTANQYAASLQKKYPDVALAVPAQ